MTLTEALGLKAGDEIATDGRGGMGIPSRVRITLPRADGDCGAASSKVVAKAAPKPEPKAPEANPEGTPKSVARVNSNQTVFDKVTRTFTVEASDLGWNGWPTVVSLVSERTGEVKNFRVDGPELDGGGEAVSMRYKCEGLTLRVYND